MKTIIIDGVEYTLTPTIKEYNDWRLPTIQELKTLVNYGKCNPACDLADALSELYWSSSSNVSDSSSAWRVYFRNGNDYWDGKSNSNFVRCVRDGDSGLEWSATSKKKMTYDEAIEYARTLVAPVYYKG